MSNPSDFEKLARLWEAVVNIAVASGLVERDRVADLSYEGAIGNVVPAIIRHLEGDDPMVNLGDRPSSPAADLLAADMKALREEMKKPLKAIGLIHKLLVGKPTKDSDYEVDLILSRIEDVCLWALLGDDDYLTDDADRVALLDQPPAAAGPSSGAPKPS